MSEALLEPALEVEAPEVEQLITEDDTPVDNIPSEKQQRLLVEPLYSSWQTERPFIAAANVGIFGMANRPPIVPDMFLSLNVEIAEDWWAKEKRSYFLWEFGKPPDVVVEIVSNSRGQETGKKLQDYARLGVWYYVIFDPQRQVQAEILQVYELHVGEYRPKPAQRLEKVGLGLTIWEGIFEGKREQWLRWCDLSGELILTGNERAERLAAQLRALGVEPEA